MKKHFFAHILLSLSLFLTSSCSNEDSKNQSPHSPADADQQAHHTSHQQSHGSTEGKTKSEQGAYLVKVVWKTAPLKADTLDNQAVVHFSNLEGEHVPATLKSFKLFMVSMGHGSLKENEMVLTQADEAHWKVENIYFSMGGPSGSWAVDIIAEVNGQTDQARVRIDQAVQ